MKLIYEIIFIQQQIISGNEKVVRPRLADAEFF
ncbi:glycine--tRNA ligase subunit beta, partial [Escherichia coli]|nr:glycine--tRNA ligase subunit beta [Escherichia coli]